MITRTDLGRWEAWMRAAGRSEKTIYLRLYQLRRVFREIPQSTPTTITVDDLITWLSAKDWSAATRRSYVVTLGGFFRWCQARGLRTDNPATLVPVVSVPRGRPRPIPEQVYLEALLTADGRVRLMIQLAAICGLRRGEISRVHTRDIVQRLDGWSLRVNGKGQHVRDVPLPDDLAAMLRAEGPGWIFTSRRPGSEGDPLTDTRIGELVSQALPDGWTCHTLRHRCGTVAYASTRDLRAVQELLGHAKPETTAIYTEVPGGALRACVAATSRRGAA